MARMTDPSEPGIRDHGPQPFDAVLRNRGLTNAGFVAAAGEQITHKHVRRAREGRQLTTRMMLKLTRILNEVVAAGMTDEERRDFTPYLHRDLFTYAKGRDAARPDPNAARPAP